MQGASQPASNMNHSPTNLLEIKTTLLDPKPRKRTMHRLEVETDSSASAPISLPYYDLSTYTRSMDTVNLLQTSSKDSSPPNQLYRNTVESQGPYEQTANEVPQRFSQFVFNEAVSVSPKGARSRSPNRESLLRRDISDLMGSQATIFSTKSQNAAPTPLKRRLAIRSKAGLVAYRLKVQMRRMAMALKRAPARCWRFVVGRRRVRRPVARGSVSAPLENQALGDGSKVLRARLMSRTRVLLQNPSLVLLHQPFMPPPIHSEYAGKMTHLSKYISEQRQLSNTLALLAAFSVELAAPPPPPHGRTRALLELQLQAERTKEASLEERQQIQEVWLRYLANVIAQRIKIRHEIYAYQALLAGRSVPLLLLPRKPSDTVSVASRRQALLVSVATVESLLDELLPETLLEDEDAKFDKVFNRRSVLGEMLDYESDRDLFGGSLVYLTENLIARSVSELRVKKDTPSVQHSLDRYGAVKRLVVRSAGVHNLQQLA